MSVDALPDRGGAGVDKHTGQEEVLAAAARICSEEDGSDLRFLLAALSPCAAPCCASSGWGVDTGSDEEDAAARARE